MNLIMENWRKFANNAETFDKSKILVETKTYKNNLQSLMFEHRLGKISNEKFSALLYESIILEQKQFLQEGIMDAIKGGINSVNDFLTMQFIKLQTLIGTSVVNAAKGIGSLGSVISKIKQYFPSLYEVGKIILMALAVYAAYKFMVGDAAADVLSDNPLASLPGEPAKIRYNPENASHIAGMLKKMAAEDPEFGTTAELIINDISSGKTIDASTIDGYQEVLDHVRSRLMRVQTGNKAMERFSKIMEVGKDALDSAKEDLQKLGKSVSQTASDTASTAGVDAGTVGQAATKGLMSASRKAAQNQDLVQQVLEDWLKEFKKAPEPQSMKGFARRVLQKAFSPEDFKKYLDSNADLKLGGMAQDIAKTLEKLPKK
jgi:hypothetical protein